MDNHIHIVAVPEHEDSFGKAIRDAHGEYSRYFNSKYGLVGHVWQGRFKSIAMEERHAWNACRYVELNPVRAGMVRRAEDYAWSSAAAHCGLREDSLLSSDSPLVKEIPNWSEWLSVDNPIGFDKLIREHTRTGRPMGSNAFIRRLESQTGRTLFPQKRGRPSQAKPDNDQEKTSCLSETPRLFG
jgi:putative transposase